MNKEQTTCICVPLNQAEKMRKILSKKKLIRKDLKFIKTIDCIYIPLKAKSSNENNLAYKIIKKKFEKHNIITNNYKEALNNIVDKKLLKQLPSSYDIIGNILLIKLPANLHKYKVEVGKSLLHSNPNIKTVCLIDSLKGEFRTRNIEFIAGEKCTKTVHKEYDLKFYLDIEKTYFSPRLATERKRITDLVKPGEIIVDMFTGVSPFSIMIAKYSEPKLIIAIDKNKDAIEFAQQNITINKVLDKIEVINVDAKEIPNILKHHNIKADRIIMNLPFSAHIFFSEALRLINKKSIIHFYDITKEEKIDTILKDLEKRAKENKVVLTNMDVKKIKTYAPREFYICVDITAKKMPM